MTVKSEKLEEVHCTIGQRTKKPNTVTMVVDSSFIKEVIDLFDILKAGKKPKSGLCGLKLIAEYVEDIEDDEKQMELIEGMHDGLKAVVEGRGIDIETGNTVYDNLNELTEESEFVQGEK